MNIKKIIAMASALAVCASMMTACGSDSAEEEVTSADTTVSESVESEADTEIAPETEGDTESEAPAESETEAPEEDAPAEDGTVDGAISNNPLQPIADAALAVGEWPALMEVTDEMMLTDFFLLDPANANYRNLLVLQCPMSAVMTEIIIIEADDVEAAKADLTARRDKAISQDAWYPNDVEVAESSIVGSEGNYAYFILAQNSADAEPAIVDAIKAL